AVPRICALLQSRTAGDVVEALRFFTRAVNFKVATALILFKSAFSLVWHQDPAIRTELLTSFRSIYLTDGSVLTSDNTPDNLSCAEIARNLIHLIKNCDTAETTSLEQIVGEMFTSGGVEGVLESLWERVEVLGPLPSKGLGCFSEIGACLRIISMVGHTQPDILTPPRIAQVVDAGLSEMRMVAGDVNAMRGAVLCLQATPGLLQSVSGAGGGGYMEGALHKELMGAVPALARIMLGADCDKSQEHKGQEQRTRGWFLLCQEAVTALFHIHPCPDKVAALVLRQMYARMGAGGSDVGDNDAKDDTEESSVSAPASPASASTPLSPTSASGSSASACALSRLLFLLGQTSLGSVVFTEQLAAAAKKYPERGGKGGGKGGKGVGGKGGEGKGQGGVAAGVGGGGGGFEEDTGAVDAMEEEMGAAAAADADHERVLNLIIEHELVRHNLLGKFLPLLSFLVANESGLYSHPLIRETATLALTRYMTTSSIVCENLLPLLFTVLPCESATVRTTIVIALGDLAFRFPNSLEPWTSHLYSRLSDQHVTVRYNTLMVITHLVLNDMIKVKGQVAMVARALNDANEHISELAKLFFLKLSERSNNPVYNLLGDIISTFSQEQAPKNPVVVEGEGEKGVEGEGEGCVEGESVEGAGEVAPTPAIPTTPTSTTSTTSPSLTKSQFQSTMHFLLSFVSRDKQADQLLERLLVRLSAAETAAQRRNLAYCIR
ncbi:non-SMC mitotic condensation complex subunit 1-domain-containing protein, partial [Ochromonadaceae sp. CCMP2298]